VGVGVRVRVRVAVGDGDPPVRVGVEGRGKRHVGEERPGRGRRREGLAVLAPQEEDGHLAARHEVLGAVVPAAATGRDPLARDLFDRPMERVALRHVMEVGEPAARKSRGRGVRVGQEDVVDRSGRRGR